MLLFSAEVGKVRQRCGRLEPAPILGVPNLPNLPNLLPRVHTSARPRIYACARDTIYLGKVRKVRNIEYPCGFQASEPRLQVGKVGKS